jgi:hypothetical protein
MHDHALRIGRIAVQPVPASVASSWLSSPAADVTSSRLRCSAVCVRPVETGWNAMRSPGSRRACTQRDHDWIRLSCSRPDGRTPSSK